MTNNRRNLPDANEEAIRIIGDLNLRGFRVPIATAIRDIQYRTLMAIPEMYGHSYHCDIHRVDEGGKCNCFVSRLQRLALSVKEGQK